MTAPRALLLDLDNTAYAYAPCHAAGLAAAQAVAAALAPAWGDAARFAADYAAARAAVKPHVAGTAAEHSRLLYFKALIERAQGRTLTDETLRLHAAYWDGYCAALRPEPGCARLLGALRGAGVRLAWVTNFTAAEQFRKLAALGLAGAADWLVTSEEAGADKPDPRPVRLALARLGVGPAEAWLVGDGVVEDGGAAAACGVPFVWIRRGDGPTPANAAAVVSHWAELREVWDAARRGQPG